MTEAKQRVAGELEQLFALLQHADDLRIPEHVRYAPRYLVMRSVALEVRMDGNQNHGRPHLHIKYEKDGHAASYAIDNGSRLAGELPSYYDGVVRKWVAENRADLLKLWQSTQRGKRDNEVLLSLSKTVIG